MSNEMAGANYNDIDEPYFSFDFDFKVEVEVETILIRTTSGLGNPPSN